MAGKKKSKFNPNDFPMRLANQSMAKNSRVRISADATPSFQFTLPQPYQPEFGSPERVQWPIDRLQQNRYWRLFCKTDPVISTVIDLYAEIIASDFTVAGEDIEGSIKDTYEYMIEKTNIISAFKYFISEFLILGEVIPHLVFDKKKGIWDNLIFHNPDQIKVIDSPFIALDPILEFTPDETLRALARSTNPTILQHMSTLPPEVQDAIISGRNIPLDTSINATFLARKIHPYDVRGTSIFTRLFRILMYEDGIMNASIATARRHAGPLKIAKLGDKDLRWVPEQDYQDKIIQLLTVAEQDPHSFLILPWFVQFEAFGTTDKMMNVGREWDIIERIKLTALGVSQGFLHGEATYASMRGNMQTLLMRLNGLRQFFVSSWFIPKFFRPIAEMNKWVKKKKSKSTKGSFRRKMANKFEDEEDFIIPDIQWSRSLDSKTDTDLMDTYEQLINRLGIPLSKKTVFPAAGIDYDAEIKNLAQEKLDAEELSKEMNVSEQTITGKEPETPPPGGGGGGGAGAPPAEGEGEGESIPLTPVEEGAPAEEAAPAAASKNKTSFFKEKILASEKIRKEAEAKRISGEIKDLISDDIFTDLVDMIKTGKTSSYWKSILKKDEKPEQFGKNFEWNRVADFLYDEGFQDYHIEGIKQELIRQELVPPSREDKLRKLVSKLSPDSADAEEQLDQVIEQVISSGDSKVSKKVNNLFLGPVNAAKIRG